MSNLEAISSWQIMFQRDFLFPKLAYKTQYFVDLFLEWILNIIFQIVSDSMAKWLFRVEDNGGIIHSMLKKEITCQCH